MRVTRDGIPVIRQQPALPCPVRHPTQIWSRDEHDKLELTTEFIFFALLRKGVREDLPRRPEGGEAPKPIRALHAVKADLSLYGTTWVEDTDAEADDVIAALAGPARRATC